MYPNGATNYIAGPPTGNGVNGIQQYEQNYSLTPGETEDCLNGPLFNAGCQTATLTYIVNAADINKALPSNGVPLVTPRGGFFFAPAQAHKIQFQAAGDAILAEGLAAGTPQTAGNATKAVLIVNPALSVTKICDTNCFKYGSPITFHGTVCNIGDDILTNISVVDIPGATITFSNQTSLGFAFPVSGGGLLRTNDCVTFTGTYQPTNNLCGPFTDTVIASGTDGFNLNDTNFVPKTVFATNSATCDVCTSPCIGVTKNCTTAVIGQPQTISGIVTNCGDVPLTNIVVSDSVIGAITNVPYLTNGAFFAYSKTVTAPCGANTNVMTATATGVCGTPVVAHATNTCLVTENPCIAITKNCITNSLVKAGDPVTFSGIVTNCGDVPLTNVVVFDTFLNQTILTVPSLAVGGTAAYSTNYITTENDACHTITNTAIVTGQTCDGRSVTNAASCTFSFCIDQQIGVTKQVACFLGVPPQISSLIQHESLGAGETCGTFSNNAVGISGTTNTAAFCYTITVTNPGPFDLTNVTVIDTNAAAGIGFGDLTTNFPCIVNGVLAVGQSCSYTFKAEVADDLTNIVTVSGQSSVTGQTVSTNATATVTIYPAEIECHKYVSVDGGPLVNSTNLPDTNPHTVVWYVTINNPSTNVNLMNVTIDDTSTNLGCAVVLAPFELDAGMTNTVAICTNTLQCTNGFTGMINTVVASADTFTLGTNHIPVCAIDINGSNVVATTANQDCSATITCPEELGCRVTGGGRQDAPLDYPQNVRYVTHGGQVGAPVGNHICTVTADFAMGNPCIHGRWQHVRHMQGGNMGNFHASLYDTLMCACLDTNLTPVTVIIPGVGTNAAQTYTNMVYGPGTVADALCNPDNNPAGPQPRPAPSNKIAFTGIGDYVETQGRRVKQVLFRVDIEDRSEPGGSKPKGGKAPPDRNRTRIWILSADEIAQLHGSGADPFLLNFRNAISACNGINVQDGASVGNGASAFGVRPPDIDDGGELSRGNYQIHPSIKGCP